MLQNGRAALRRPTLLSASPEAVRSFLAAGCLQPGPSAVINGLVGVALTGYLPVWLCALWWAALLGFDVVFSHWVRARLRLARTTWTFGLALHTALIAVIRNLIFVAPLCVAVLQPSEASVMLAAFAFAGIVLVNMVQSMPLPITLPILMLPSAMGISLMVAANIERTGVSHGALTGLAFMLCAGVVMIYMAGANQRLSRLHHRQAELIAALEAARDDAETGLAAARDAEERARQADAAKSSFLATMSHEIRTPLSGVIGAADLLKARPLDKESAGLVVTIQRSGELLLAILNDILDYSKIESGHLDLDAQPAELRSTLIACAKAFEPKAQEKRVRIFVDLDPSVPTRATFDDRRLRQILLNLVSNAVKFTDHGEVHLRAFASTQAGQTRLTVEVHDTGAGITPDTVERLFKPFVQADVAVFRRHGGTGLGLAISQRLAHLMGGEISVQSEERVGSVFTLTLPVVQPHMDAEQSAREGGQRNLAGVRVLVAEDNHTNRTIVAAVLKTFGIDATCVENGRDALHALGAHTFDAVLMDIQMPEVDGLEATRLLRARPGPNRFTPVIALTANAFDDDRRRCAQAGMTDFLSKPVRPPELHAAIVRATTGRAEVSAA